MIRLFLVSDLCEHPGSHKDFTVLPGKVELSCRTCGRSESSPFKTMPTRQVKPDECLRMDGIDFTPYMQPQPKEP